MTFLMLTFKECPAKMCEAMPSACCSFSLELLFLREMHDLNVVFEMATDLKCVQGLTLWRDNPSLINDELYKGYRQSNSENKENEFIAGDLCSYIFLFIYLFISA